ncbi:integrator complex subunit 1 [Mytilus galloprovincialis]|uniref:Integrator complex subunit 1 n=1 Tax=Mytilus galloprovincialis TaxID=29158 RepID=A0A8B6DU55_MYTGA|nr:integrator complex subunit 1 [Mytilus galloprovincialis]
MWTQDTKCEEVKPKAVWQNYQEHFDNYEKEEKDRRKKIDSFHAILRNHPKRKHNRHSYFLSNHEPFEYKTEFENIRTQILKLAAEIPKWGDNLPTRWIILEKEIDSQIDKGNLIISYEEAMKLAEDCSFPIKVIDSELKSFLTYEHEIGNLIFFDDIRSFIVVEPKWLVNIFRCFVSPFQFQSDFLNELEWSELQLTGILRDSLITKLFKKVPNLDTAKHSQFALQIMEKFDIIVKPLITTSEEGNGEYYIPCMIKASKCEGVLDNFKVGSKTCSKSSWFILKFNFLPPSFFNHILVSFVKKYILCKDKNDRLQLYRSMGVFNLKNNGCEKLIVCLSENSVAMQIWQYHDEELQICDTNHIHIRTNLIDTVDLLQQRYKIKIYYKCYLKCGEGTYQTETGRIHCDETGGKFHCHDHGAPHSLEELRRYWFEGWFHKVCLFVIVLIYSYNPTAVLDFLWACLQIPKIWRGREQKLPKNHTLEDVLALMPQHVISVVEFIVQEVGMVTGKSVDGSTSEDKIRHRSKLLMSCIGENDMSMKCVIKHVVTAIHDNRYKSIYEHVLMELYSQCPKILFLMADSAVCLTDIKTSHTFVTQVDLVSHRLLTGLGEGGHGRRAEERMSDATLALKKLAAQHPVLLLRQLPLIAALLKGKTEFKFGEMRHKNYVTMFTHVQALLENLQPHVFSKDLIALEDIIGSYFSLIENHGDQKVLMPIIAKFIRFLNKFVTSQPQKSVVMLQKHVKLLSDVSALYPDMAGLKSLLAGLCLPTQDKGGDSPVLSVSPIPVLPQRPTSPYTASQLAPFVKKFKGTSQDVLEVLKELDEFSKRKVDILENFMVYLKVKVYDSNDQIRNTAFNLIMRHVRQSPSTAIQYVGLYLQCLNSNNPDVVTSALKILAEFCVLCQDQSNLILQKAFMVGTTTSLDTGSYITETLQLLNLDPMSN